MKNFFLGLIVVLVLLPQLSFAADVSPQVAACNKTEDAEANAFFGQQGVERKAFIQANKGLIDKQDRRGRWMLSHKAHDGSVAPADLTSDEQTAFAVFVQKQQSDKAAFLAKLNQERQTCLNS